LERYCEWCTDPELECGWLEDRPLRCDMLGSKVRLVDRSPGPIRVHHWSVASVVLQLGDARSDRISRREYAKSDLIVQQHDRGAGNSGDVGADCSETLRGLLEGCLLDESEHALHFSSISAVGSINVPSRRAVILLIGGGWPGWAARHQDLRCKPT
jgi:hypothetical protein